MNDGSDCHGAVMHAIDNSVAVNKALTQSAIFKFRNHSAREWKSSESSRSPDYLSNDGGRVES